jgi:hypothetical protein
MGTAAQIAGIPVSRSIDLGRPQMFTSRLEPSSVEQGGNSVHPGAGTLAPLERSNPHALSWSSRFFPVRASRNVPFMLLTGVRVVNLGIRPALPKVPSHASRVACE